MNGIQQIEITEKHFYPLHTFECGQCFRWREEGDKSYTGVAYGRVINARKNGDKLIINNAPAADYENIWKRYFDIERDYGKIKTALSFDKTLRTAMDYGWGIRILRQEFFECLISFIISANNNIPRIQGIIERFSQKYGEKIVYNGKRYHAFPDPFRLEGIEEGDLAFLKAGYRAKYIANAVKSFQKGEIIEEEIESMPLSLARKTLCGVSGVGPKVADCVLLFSFGRLGAFPVDVWVKRAMRDIYGLEEKKAAEGGAKLFGDLSGIAQQYLFYWKREGEA